MMARQRQFQDPLYAFRSDDDGSPQLLARKQEEQAQKIRQWIMLSVGGMGLIAGLVWIAWPAERQVVGASTDAFARDDGRGRMLGAPPTGPGAGKGLTDAGQGTKRPRTGGMLGPKERETGRRTEQRQDAAAAVATPRWDAAVERVAASEARGGIAPQQGAARGVSGFRRCSSGVTQCVIDGAQFRWNNRIVELADAEVPNPRLPACQEEAIIGARSLARLASLLNDGPFVISPQSLGKGKRGAERHIVMRQGVSIGAVLIEEGLARRPGASVPRWC
ncbi:hypothetical protein [Sphingomonas sp. FW199]|uniref:hypothetical protein n=1 Tax=Sphingomonas sp. FW199 TaxID=3400217 RepID=UPI003CEFC0E0